MLSTERRRHDVHVLFVWWRYLWRQKRAFYLSIFRVTRLTETKYRNETEIPKRTIKNVGKESNLHL